MSRAKINSILIGLLGAVLMGLSTWVLITLIEVKTVVAMMQQELLDFDKVVGRIYYHMDQLLNKK